MCVPVLSTSLSNSSCWLPPKALLPVRRLVCERGEMPLPRAGAPVALRYVSTGCSWEEGRRRPGVCAVRGRGRGENGRACPRVGVPCPYPSPLVLICPCLSLGGRDTTPTHRSGGHGRAPVEAGKGRRLWRRCGNCAARSGRGRRVLSPLGAGWRGVPIGTDGAAARGAAEHNKKRGTARHLCQIAAQGPRRRGRAHELPQNMLQGARVLDCPPSQLVTGNGSLPCPPPVLSMSWPCPRNVLAMSCSGPADTPWADEAGRGDNNAGGKGVHGRGARTRAPEPQSASTSATTGARAPSLHVRKTHLLFYFKWSRVLPLLSRCPIALVSTPSSWLASFHFVLILLTTLPPRAHTNALTIAYKTHPNRHLLIHQC